MSHPNEHRPSPSQTPILSPPFLTRPIEICIVTPTLKTTLDGLLRLGIGPFKIFHFNPSTVTSQTFRGQPADFEIEVAFAEQGDMIWEVMCPVRGESVMKEFLEQTGGRGGIQHVAFGCKEGREEGELVGEQAREEAMRRRAEFEKRGFPLIQNGIWHGKTGTCEFMFFDTQGAINTCFETYVFSDDWEEPEDGEHYPPLPTS